MRKLIALSAVFALSLASFAQAANINLVPDKAGEYRLGETGSIDVIVDNTSGPLTFVNGSLGLSLSSATSGVIKFTSAMVHTPDFFGGALKRWSAGSAVNVLDDTIDELLGVSVSTVGLNDAAPTGDNADGGGPGLFKFATINFEVVDAGQTVLTPGKITSRPGSFIVQAGQNVESQVTMNPLTITVVPEPTTMIMAGLGLLGCVAVRRR